jgi:hypothetical protein
VDEGFVVAIRQAKEAVESAGLSLDSPAGVKAFETVLERSLPSTEGSNRPLEGLTQAVEGAPIFRVASWAGVQPDAVGDYFVFEEGAVKVEVPARLLSSSRAEMQRQLALLKLGIDREGYEREELRGSEITDLFQSYGCLDQNVTRNLEAYSNYVVRRGGARSYSFRLTRPGRDASRDLLRRILNAA